MAKFNFEVFMKKHGWKKRIYLSHKNLTELPANLFEKCEELEYLDLCGNNLTELPPTLLENCIHLKELHVCNNKLTEIPSTLLKNNTKLEVLNLSNNKLTSLPPTLLKNCKKLELLNLGSNALSSIPPILLEKCINLKELYLNENNLTSLPSNFLEASKSMLMITLHKNNLTSLPSKLLKRKDIIFRFEHLEKEMNSNKRKSPSPKIKIPSPKMKTPSPKMKSSPKKGKEVLKINEILGMDDKSVYEKMTVKELKEELKKQGKPVSGKKAELIARLQEKKEGKEKKKEKEKGTYEKMTVKELKEELKKQHKPVSGKKADLIARLQGEKEEEKEKKKEKEKGTYDKMTVKELKEELKKRNISFKSNTKKAELILLLEEEGEKKKEKEEEREEKELEKIQSHYNEINNKREETNILALRKFNNWIKINLINDAVGEEKEVTVLDLCCGKGGDMMKWLKIGASRVVFCDIANKSLDEARERYNKIKGRKFKADFIEIDCFSDKVTNALRRVKAPLFDIISCQFAIHYAFSSKERVENIFRTVDENLSENGIFIGTTTNARWLLENGKKHKKFGNDIFQVEFQEKIKEKKDFGIGYSFSLGNAVDNLKEYVVKPTILKKYGEEANLELFHIANFSKYEEELNKNEEARKLRKSMKIGELNKQEKELLQAYIVFTFTRFSD